MSPLSADAATPIAKHFPWGDYRNFVDVGVAQEMVPVTIAHAHPHLIGTAFDLPAVKPIFEEFVVAHRLSERITFQGGNFFEHPLPRADVLIMGHILHDWDLAPLVSG